MWEKWETTRCKEGDLKSSETRSNVLVKNIDLKKNIFFNYIYFWIYVLRTVFSFQSLQNKEKKNNMFSGNWIKLHYLKTAEEKEINNWFISLPQKEKLGIIQCLFKHLAIQIDKINVHKVSKDDYNKYNKLNNKLTV